LFKSIDLAAFALTVAIEWPIFAWISKLGFRRTAGFCVLMNAVTWFALAGTLSRFDLPLPPLEFAIMAVEAALIVWFWRLSLGRAIVAAVVMNLVSWIGGTVLIELLAGYL